VLILLSLLSLVYTVCPHHLARAHKDARSGSHVTSLSSHISHYTSQCSHVALLGSHVRLPGRLARFSWVHLKVSQKNSSKEDPIYPKINVTKYTSLIVIYSWIICVLILLSLLSFVYTVCPHHLARAHKDARSGSHVTWLSSQTSISPR